MLSRELHDRIDFFFPDADGLFLTTLHIYIYKPFFIANPTLSEMNGHVKTDGGPPTVGERGDDLNITRARYSSPTLLAFCNDRYSLVHARTFLHVIDIQITHSHLSFSLSFPGKQLLLHLLGASVFCDRS